MADSSSPRSDFQPDGIASDALNANDQAPALSSSAALARFEFAAGAQGNGGTKILMVEWEGDTEDGSNSSGDWEVSWEGKKTVLSARDGAEGKLHRIYFLLGPGISIPAVVKLAQAGGKVMQTNPLPAIFPAELGGTTAGKLGVLHTVWAKKRLSVLQKEIEDEMKTNGEGIGLEMAMQEKQWIEDNFGVGPRAVSDLQYSATPSSPKSPGGGRLAGKLKGLRLGTSASALSGPSSGPEASRSESHPLSPDLGDHAVSSFAAFHGASAKQLPRAIAQHPPGYLVAKQNDSRGGSRINSLDAVASGEATKRDDPETEDALFAVKLSPRSPEMTKSPFSFAAKDTAPWLKDNE